MARRAAVIGAGLAGLTAARTLFDAGWSVTVLEKSRGVGGRLATRRTRDGLDYDHGAACVSPESAPFAEFLSAAEDAGWAARHGGEVVGLPGMSGLVSGLARGLEIRFAAEAAAVTRAGACWAVDGDSFDAVVCSAPAPQSARLCARSAIVADAAQAARMDPCYTVMAAWEGAFEAGAPLAPLRSLSHVSAKPGRGATPDRWAAHADLDWTCANLEREREDVLPELLDALARTIGADPAAARHAAAHRWRFARVAAPVGAPYVADGRLVACGDWLLGPDAGHAYVSGLAAARALIEA